MLIRYVYSTGALCAFFNLAALPLHAQESTPSAETAAQSTPSADSAPSAGTPPADAAAAAASPAAPTPAEAPGEPAEEAKSPAIQLALFADTYVSYNSSKAGTPVPYHRAYDNNTPYDSVTDFPTGDNGEPAPLASRNGFGLSFVGLDASFDAGKVGATAQLRFGPSVPIYYGSDTGAAGIDAFLGGFVTIKPTSSVTIDAGYFPTIYGAEVAESWRNLNYSRGGLYYAMQPFYHFGAKAALALSDSLTLRALVANGANNVADENDSPAFGLQLAGTGLGGGLLDFALGGFYESGPDSSWGIESLIDVVVTLHLGPATLLLNGDYNINRGDDSLDDGEAGAEDTSYYGIMGTLAYPLTDQVGVAVRGEYLVDSDNAVWSVPDAEDLNVTTLTGTLDLKLLDHLIVRPELRYEMASEEIYADTDGEGIKTWYSGMIGVVATSGP
jgi:hypothetical protein